MSDLTPAPPEPQPPPPSLPFQVPADYYSAPVGRPPMFPRWAPIGCGTAALLLVVVLFIGGAFASHGGMGRFMDILLEMMEGQMVTMYSDDVPPAERKALESELDALRANIRTERVPIPSLDPVMSSLRESIADKKLTKEEVAGLRKKIAEANKPQASKR